VVVVGMGGCLGERGSKSGGWGDGRVRYLTTAEISRGKFSDSGGGEVMVCWRKTGGPLGFYSHTLVSCQLDENRKWIFGRQGRKESD
jgi:hypothetical protein